MTEKKHIGTDLQHWYLLRLTNQLLMMQHLPCFICPQTLTCYCNYHHCIKLPGS